MFSELLSIYFPQLKQIDHFVLDTSIAALLIIIFLVFLYIYIIKSSQSILNAKQNDYNSKQFTSPCTTTWNKGEKYFHCDTCTNNKMLTICAHCFHNSQHWHHSYEAYTSEFNGSCDCGDSDVMDPLLFCKQHANCQQNLIIYKNSYNNNKQISKISMLLNTDDENAKRLAELNKLNSICELTFKGKMIKEYFKNSQYPSINMSLTNVYAVYRSEHENQFKENEFLNETRMLLWHGTLRENLIHIFNNGFKLPLISGMFGNGIYFADRVSKSANYTDCGRYKGSKGNSGVLLLCEVAVGKMCKLKSAQKDLTEPPFSYQSVKGLGRYEPSSVCTYKRTKIIVPLGTTQKSIGNELNELYYNEYIVYDTRRVLIKFFVEFERN